MKKLAFFGGTFDPIHNGHLIVAEQVRSDLKLDEIIFLPNKIPPHKAKTSVSSEARFELVKKATENNPYFWVSNLELISEKTSFTFHTLQKLKELYFESDLYFIIGADSLLDFHKWYKYEGLLELATFIVFPRIIKKEGQEILANQIYLENYLKNSVLASYTQKFLIMNTPFIEISSTDIRNRVLNLDSIRYLVPEEIRSKIERYYQIIG